MGFMLWPPASWLQDVVMPLAPGAADAGAKDQLLVFVGSKLR